MKVSLLVSTSLLKVSWCNSREEDAESKELKGQGTKGSHHGSGHWTMCGQSKRFKGEVCEIQIVGFGDEVGVSI